MPLVTFSPNTKILSAAVNANNSGLADGSLDTTANSLATTRLLTMANFVSSGCTLPTSANLSSTIAAGIVFVNGKYVPVSTTVKTFTASKDTYIDVKDDGTIVYVEVANGATTGMTLTLNSDGSNALRIAKAVTSGTAVTSVAQGGIDWLGWQIFNKNPFGVNQWFRPTFQNSWVDYDTTTFGPVWYGKDKTGIVHVMGIIKNGTTTAATILFNLPAGYRPAIQALINGLTNDVIHRCDVKTNGDVILGIAGNAAYVSLNNIQFVAAN